MVKCRLCGSSELTRFLDLGHTPPADDFIPAERTSEAEIHYPLRMVFCDECHFVQLDYVVDAAVLYQNDYPYEASMTATGRQHFGDFAESIVQVFGFGENDLVVDIGSNVGVLLSAFSECGTQVLGVDPADKIAAIANADGIETICDFFSEPVAKGIIKSHGNASCITASNVFAHIDDLDALMRGVSNLLTEDGIFVIEAPYFVHLLGNLEYDTVYHEHLSYLTVTPLVRFFRKHGLDLFDVQQKDIHGGSIRIFVGRKNCHDITPEVGKLATYEAVHKTTSIATLGKFAKEVREHRDELVWLLTSLKRKGHRIAGVSASAKGMTLLNYCGIERETLEFITEKSKLKIGRFAPGNHIPILPDDALMDQDIDYALVLAWNFKDEIMSNLKNFADKGGKFIIPVPQPLIVDPRAYQHKV